MINLAKIVEYKKLMSLTANYYLDNLKKQPQIMRSEVLSRVSEQIIDEFKLGLSYKNSLPTFLTANNLCLKQAETLSLVSKNKDDLYVEFFNNRIIIPIISANIIAGFAGRKLYEKQVPKYLNSRASFFYNKSCILYGLWQNFDHIIKEKSVILVEGYFDVLTLCSYGIRNVVSPCGTTLSEYQAKILTTIADRVYIVYDGDVAGQRESKKVKNILKNSKLITLPHGDPDEYVKEFGVDAFNTLLEGAS